MGSLLPTTRPPWTPPPFVAAAPDQLDTWPAPERRAVLDRLRVVDLAALCDEDPPRAAMGLDDGIHLSPAGYRALGDEAFEDEPKPPKARRRAKPKAE